MKKSDAEKLVGEIELAIEMRITLMNEKCDSLAKAMDSARASKNWEAASNLGAQLQSAWSHRSGLHEALVQVHLVGIKYEKEGK